MNIAGIPYNRYHEIVKAAGAEGFTVTALRLFREETTSAAPFLSEFEKWLTTDPQVEKDRLLISAFLKGAMTANDQPTCIQDDYRLTKAQVLAGVKAVGTYIEDN